MTEPHRLSAADAARRIRAGRLTPAGLMEACLDRIADREPVVRAFAHLDPAAARRAAREVLGGTLLGLPVGIKDVIDTHDMPTEYHSPLYRGHRPRADAACVAWTRAQGGVIIGKTVTTEFAYRHPGPTTHPLDPARTPGGSSSGSAAGVADFMFPLAFGTQTGGSTIRPAAYCGIVGYKPSFGLISRAGVKQLAESFDHVGIMARTVEDCALLAAAVSGADLGQPTDHTATAPRIGICRSPAWPHAHEDARRLLERLATELGRAGAKVEQRELPASYDDVQETHRAVMAMEAARALGWEYRTGRGSLSAALTGMLEWGLAQPGTALMTAHAMYARWRARFAGVMDDLDILLTPAAAGEAPAGLHDTGDHAFNCIWTGLHVPCVTIPAGTGSHGLPLGIQIVGRFGDDRAVLAWAQWVAAAIT